MSLIVQVIKNIWPRLLAGRRAAVPRADYILAEDGGLITAENGEVITAE